MFKSYRHLDSSEIEKMVSEDDWGDFMDMCCPGNNMLAGKAKTAYGYKWKIIEE